MHKIATCRSPELVLLLIAMLTSGCVRRTMIITTAPSTARVFLNDEEIGRSKVSTDFIWYGNYDVVIRKEGYKTLNTGWVVPQPWYERWPIDFFAEVLWPGRIHDVHRRHFELEPFEAPSSAELIERAVELQGRAVTQQPSTQ